MTRKQNKTTMIILMTVLDMAGLLVGIGGVGILIYVL